MITQAYQPVVLDQSVEQAKMLDAAKRAHIREVSEDFESLFVTQLLKEFDKTVDHEANILYGGHAEDVYRNMFNQELSRSIAQNSGFGIADMVEQSVIDHEMRK